MLTQAWIHLAVRDPIDTALYTTLNVTSQPVTTNGWYANGKITWAGPLAARDSEFKVLPAICMAAWAVADEEFQKEHFDQLIQGKDLLDYCLWRANLTPEEGRTWDAMVAKLRPGQAGAMPSFRFGTEPPRTFDANGNVTSPIRYVDEGIRLLERGFEPPSTQPAGTTGTAPAAEPASQAAEVLGDPELTAATLQARKTVGSFLAALKAPRETQTLFAVKVAITKGKATEVLWVGDVTFDGTKLHGRIMGQPAVLTALEPGDPCEVEPAKVRDWMYVDDGKLVGGYTIRVLRLRMTDAERRKADKEAGFRVE